MSTRAKLPEDAQSWLLIALCVLAVAVFLMGRRPKRAAVRPDVDARLRGGLQHIGQQIAESDELARQYPPVTGESEGC